LKGIACFGGTICLHLQCLGSAFYLLNAGLFFGPFVYLKVVDVSPKRLLNFIRLHGVIIERLVTTTVLISPLACRNQVHDPMFIQLGLEHVPSLSYFIFPLSLSNENITFR
jgi:hypothetical protein